VNLVKAAVEAAASKHGFDVLVYCFMPDHLHALVEGRDDNSSFPAFVAAFKQRSAVDYATAHRGRLWQEGYWDRVLRTQQSTVEAVRYIAANPVRAGLVEDPCRYPFTGSGVLDLATLLVDVGIDAERRG
jgi:putative transposase